MFLLCSTMFPLATSAQTYRVGEAFVKDGVPCIVINVDESGEHGLAMSLRPTWKALKTAKKTGEYKWFYHSRKLKGKEAKLIAECRAEYYNRFKSDTLRIRTSGVSTAVRTVTSISGRENMKNVIDYCDDKGISMEMYFNEYYWAQNLGEGWFIPGAEELEMFIRIFGYEAFGFKNAQGMRKYPKNLKAALNTYTSSLSNLTQDDLQCFIDANAPSDNVNIYSSTMVNDGKKSLPLLLTPMIQKISAKHWFDMAPLFGRGLTYRCAVCEF